MLTIVVAIYLLGIIVIFVSRRGLLERACRLGILADHVTDRSIPSLVAVGSQVAVTSLCQPQVVSTWRKRGFRCIIGGYITGVTVASLKRSSASTTRGPSGCWWPSAIITGVIIVVLGLGLLAVTLNKHLNKAK